MDTVIDLVAKELVKHVLRRAVGQPERWRHPRVATLVRQAIECL
jgi:hypothetical protein